jgi:hypothetical protein
MFQLSTILSLSLTILIFKKFIVVLLVKDVYDLVTKSSHSEKNSIRVVSLKKSRFVFIC